MCGIRREGDGRQALVSGVVDISLSGEKNSNQIQIIRSIMTWENITISQYRRICDLSDSGLGELEFVAKLLEIVLGKTEKEILDMPVDEFRQKMGMLAFLKEPLEPAMHRPHYVVDGKKYRLTLNADKMTAGQYIDYTTTLREDGGNYALLTAILLVPEGKEYAEGYDVRELAEEFGDRFRIVDVLGICFFFGKP